MRGGAEAWLAAWAGVLVSAAVLHAAPSPQAVGPPPAEGPLNLIVLGLDTVRADHLGCYGSSEVRTPELDAFAREAVLFERCSAAATWTLPSFASVFTGLWPYHHGAVGATHKVVQPEAIMLQEMLRAFGYHTYAFVAVDWLGRNFHFDRGFERHFAHVQGVVTGRLRIYQKRVLQFTRKPWGRPYYLFVHYFDAHDPYRPPEPYRGMYYHGNERDPRNTSLRVIYSAANRIERDREERYAWLRGITDIDYPVKEYAGGITYLDHHVGEVLRGLRASGELDRSIVVVLADHGEHLTEHSIYFTHRFPYEECLHVPLLIRLPHGRFGGLRIAEEVSLVDLLPTLLELLDIPLPRPVDGVSLVPLLEGARHLHRKELFAEYGSAPGNLVRAVWNRSYRLLSFSQGDSTWCELYDRRNDPGEEHDLAARDRRRVRRMRALLEDRFPPDRAVARQGEPLPPLDPEVEARLRALGYIE